MVTNTDAGTTLEHAARAASPALQRSEHRFILVSGDLIAAIAATLLSMRIWSVTAGFPFDGAFVTAQDGRQIDPLTFIGR